jgi:hypothetical protein
VLPPRLVTFPTVTCSCAGRGPWTQGEVVPSMPELWRHAMRQNGRYQVQRLLAHGSLTSHSLLTDVGWCLAAAHVCRATRGEAPSPRLRLRSCCRAVGKPKRLNRRISDLP